MAWVATAIAGSAILGAGASIFAANTQAKAAQNATNAQMSMFQQGSQQLQPFINLGKSTSNQLSAALPGLGATFNPTMQDLENTPGYQFTLDQGMKSLESQQSALGLAGSGAEAKGLQQYTTGLASQTFQQQFENYLQQKQQQYNMLYQPTQLGASAGASLLGGSIQTGGQIGSNIIGAGNAQAAGLLGASASGSNALNSYMQWSLMQRLLGGNAPQVNNAALPSTGAGYSNLMNSSGFSVGGA